MIEAAPQPPEDLQAGDDLRVSLGPGRQLALRRYRVRLRGCPERPAIGLDRAYSARPLVMLDKQATFPELAVLAFLRRLGWDGAWADVAHHKYFDRMPNQSKGISLDAHASQALTRVAQYADRGRVDCWDLVLWKDRTVAFAAVVQEREPSGTAADGGSTLGEVRMRWLAAAVKAGMSPAQFVVVEWAYLRVAARKRRGG